MNGYPTEYERFEELARKFKIKSKQQKTIELMSRFANRYRLAKNLEGLCVRDIGKTLLGYNSLAKAFFAHTTREAAETTGRHLKLATVDWDVIVDARLARDLRLNTKMFEYFISSTSIREVWKAQLQEFGKGNHDNVWCVSYAVRNCFAHGELTASTIYLGKKKNRDALDDLASKVLQSSDDIFSKCVGRMVTY